MPTRSTLPPTERARYVRNPITGYFEKDAFSAPQNPAAALPDTLRLEDAFSGQIRGNARKVLTLIRNPAEPLALGRAPVFTGLRQVAPSFPLLAYGNRLHVIKCVSRLSDIISLFSDDGQALVLFQLTGKHYKRPASQRQAALSFFPEMRALLQGSPLPGVATSQNITF